MLQRQLAECEAQIAAARRTYNASIMDYHNSIEMFPSSIVYLIADFHKHFNGRVLIKPDIAEARFGWLGRKLQDFSGDLVRLENPDFERAFKIRAIDPVEARYLLTPDMQERFLELRNRWSPNIHAALIDSRLHLAIPRSENWFEPDVNSPATNVLPLSDFIQQLVHLLHITEQLDLNTRLWTKQ